MVNTLKSLEVAGKIQTQIHKEKRKFAEKMGSSGNLMVNTVKQKLGAVSGPDSPTHSVSDLCGGVSATAMLLCIPIYAMHCTK